ncbi:endonuclease [Paenibacillus sp. FSL R7-0273]|uniref:YraN family protein n=1 Tax=Paenibacillus sp. FSL R7-0273 TaxID=1536772 RepID=UPI0004F6DF35|nr:YraN family protein [Paenibacillus sp. FSL R7-0273]AIQ47881.1 endonuclease [Paenibacillus sp. FSL R7-0273]OMF94567.1 YraN family protein [Paenibacillus sp. FSL R7-0273]
MSGLPVSGRYNRKLKGAAAEAAAALYLASRGYTVLERNWRCRSGELDLIAEYQGVLVFIEVRSRSGSPLPGTPEESVDARKIRKVRSTAKVYLHMRNQEECAVSFDVISVQLNPDLSVAALRHIREAF